MKNHSFKHIRDVVKYTKKYSHCLLKENFSEFYSFSPSKRKHVLAAFSNSSNFLGKYCDFPIV